MDGVDLPRLSTKREPADKKVVWHEDVVWFGCIMPREWPGCSPPYWPVIIYMRLIVAPNCPTFPRSFPYSIVAATVRPRNLQLEIYSDWQTRKVPWSEVGLAATATRLDTTTGRRKKGNKKWPCPHNHLPNMSKTMFWLLNWKCSVGSWQVAGQVLAVDQLEDWSDWLDDFLA